MEQRLKELGIDLPPPPQPLGAYVEAAQSGNLLFLSGALPVEGGSARYQGRIGRDLSIEDGRKAARLATLNALALARQHLGSLERVSRIVRLKVTLATSEDFRDHPEVADAASQVLVDIFGKQNASTRMVAGAFTLPLGVSVVVELVIAVR